MQLNEAVAERIRELCRERDMTQYQLFLASGVSQSTLSTVVRCVYPSVRLHSIYEICEGLGISLGQFFDSPLFAREKLDD